ncbi:ATP-binding protein [Spirosoma flavum]|uniref:Histidine kinase/HSP90-like ATPase domain-containing protein n=1 Tax=Spirosoma flavum TaxID=2048557 RepID=A0ABW6AFZ7_9BACT
MQSVTQSYWLGKGFSGVIEIRVKDNGMGIPDTANAKIFQPFFTNSGLTVRAVRVCNATLSGHLPRLYVTP